MKTKKKDHFEYVFPMRELKQIVYRNLSTKIENFKPFSAYKEHEPQNYQLARNIASK